MNKPLLNKGEKNKKKKIGGAVIKKKLSYKKEKKNVGQIWKNKSIISFFFFSPAVCVCVCRGVAESIYIDREKWF